MNMNNMMKQMDQTMKDMEKMKDMMMKANMREMSNQMNQEMDHMRKMKEMMMMKKGM